MTGPDNILQTSKSTCWDPVAMSRFGVPQVWSKYAGKLTWGRGQCMAIIDDGCDLHEPAWCALLPWGPKVVATFNSIDGTDEPAFGPEGYHGTTVGYPSSICLDDKHGVAYHNQVAHIRGVNRVHLQDDESEHLAAALRWVLQHRERYNITSVNLSPLDDVAHQKTHPSVIDQPLADLRAAGVWVSSPCGNNDYIDGISWPACQTGVFAIGSTDPQTGELRNDRYHNTDLVVPSTMTSSGNAYAAGASMILREALSITGYDWSQDGDNMPDAIMSIFQRTSTSVVDKITGIQYFQLNLLAAVDEVFGE